MIKILHCGLYFAAIGILGFLAGRLLPKKWFRYDLFPYKTMPVEHDGRIYRVLHIRNWADKLPDMSRLFKSMPSKKLSGKPTYEELDTMIRETCIAESIHGILNVAGLGCFFIWKSAWAVSLYLLYVLCNLPFMLIQRYNRPRLLRLLRRY